MRSPYRNILDSIPKSVREDRLTNAVKREKIKKIGDLLITSIKWSDTLEGHEFWSYVHKRLDQLSEGIGWRQDEDIKD